MFKKLKKIWQFSKQEFKNSKKKENNNVEIKKTESKIEHDHIKKIVISDTNLTKSNQNRLKKLKEKMQA